MSQLCPPPGLPLSTTPLQSLSRPSQVSGEGCTVSLQTTAPLVHDVGPRRADALEAGVAVQAGAGRAVVDHAVAVVVGAVAGLLRRRLLAHARAPLAVHAGLRAVVARAHAERLGRAGVAGLGRAVHAGAALVDLAVAVVVDAVAADLGARGAGHAGRRLAVGARGHRDLARADAAGDRAEPVAGARRGVAVAVLAGLAARGSPRRARRSRTPRRGRRSRGPSRCRSARRRCSSGPGRRCRVQTPLEQSLADGAADAVRARRADRAAAVDARLGAVLHAVVAARAPGRSRRRTRRAVQSESTRHVLADRALRAGRAAAVDVGLGAVLHAVGAGRRPGRRCRCRRRSGSRRRRRSPRRRRRAGRRRRSRRRSRSRS